MKTRLRTVLGRPHQTAVLAAGCCWALFGGLSGCNDTISDRDVTMVTLAEVRRLAGSDKVVIVDPRSPAEFAQGHLPGARNIQLAQVTEKREELDPALAAAGTIIVYGDDPGSGVAKGMTKRLLRAGQKNARFFPGGVSEWQRSGLPLSKPAGK